MLFTSSQLQVPGGGHVGYVAGRYRDGAASDQWTDVTRCSPRTFTGYAGACTCGWRGEWMPVDAVGLITARRSWLTEHLPSVVRSPAADQAPTRLSPGAHSAGTAMTS